MTVLTVILIALFLTIMVLVSKIQGTARVVNYAGLVRGKTQRIIKLEDAKEPQDEMIESVASFIEGLRYGSDELNLVRLDDRAFQNKMKELEEHFQKLQKEIRQVRKEGYENTEIIEKSETFFVICDEATGLAEKYAQKKATALERLEKIVIADIIGLVCLLAYELIKAVKYAAQNKALKKKVYLDEATGLPNKNRCEEILDGEMPECTDGSVALCVFDLNNLRIINNRLGHDQGDAYIRSFAVQLRKALPEEYFAGRDGGDEFIAVLECVDHEKVREILGTIRSEIARYSQEHPEMPISYAVGYALAEDFEGCTMRELFRHADKNMYIDKNQAKIKEAADRRALHIQILDGIRQQGFQFSDCLFHISQKQKSLLPACCINTMDIATHRPQDRQELIHTFFRLQCCDCESFYRFITDLRRNFFKFFPIVRDFTSGFLQNLLIIKHRRTVHSKRLSIDSSIRRTWCQRFF